VIEAGVDFILGGGSIYRPMGTFSVAWVNTPDSLSSIFYNAYVIFEF
jgi:hypothetical protein